MRGRSSGGCVQLWHGEAAHEDCDVHQDEAVDDDAQLGLERAEVQVGQRHAMVPPCRAGERVAKGFREVGAYAWLGARRGAAREAERASTP